MPSCFDDFLPSPWMAAASHRGRRGAGSGKAPPGANGGRRGCFLLDGGLASELERAGHDLNDPLWSARILIDDPGAVSAVHRAFLEAGADCITTATYQATFEGLAARGFAAPDAERILLGAVNLAVRARDRFRTAATRPPPIVAASVGPYGAFLADGSEYRGDYGIGPAALADFHRRRWRLLARSAADVMLCETIPALGEARVLAGLAGDSFPKPVWFSFTCRDDAHLCDGTPISEVAAWAEECSAAAAVGVNCTAPELIPTLVGALASGTSKPILAYPNGGGTWDAVAKRWGRAGMLADWGAACRSWIAAGAAGVGGCCRIGPDVISAMRAVLDGSVQR